MPLPLAMDKRTIFLPWKQCNLTSGMNTVQILDYPKSNWIFNQNMHQQMVLLRCPNWNALYLQFLSHPPPPPPTSVVSQKEVFVKLKTALMICSTSFGMIYLWNDKKTNKIRQLFLHPENNQKIARFVGEL